MSSRRVLRLYVAGTSLLLLVVGCAKRSPLLGEASRCTAHAGASVIGRVLDDSTDLPLPALLRVSGRNDYTTADVRTGKFALVGLPPGQHEVQIMFIGYVPQRHRVDLPLQGCRVITVRLTSRPSSPGAIAIP
jgi:hypothetical protein